MDRIPTSFELSRIEFCPIDLLPETMNKPSFLIPHIVFSKGLDYLFKLKVGQKTNKRNMEQFVRSNFVTSEQDKYISIFNQIILEMVKINKKTPIVGQDLLSKYDLGNGLTVNCKVHYVYNREEGPCYGVVLSDTLQSKRISEEYIMTHILTSGAVLADHETNKDQIRFVEVIAFYDDGKDWDRFVIRIGPHQGLLIEHAHSSLLKNTRRFHLEKESHANWSNKCIWCPQDSTCSGISTWREYSRQLIQRTRHRDD